MSVGLIENVGKSLGYTVDNTVKKFLRWIGLTIVMCIPIVNFIADGIFLKVFRGEELNFSNAGKSFIQGLLFFIIRLIYMLIPIIIFFPLGGASFITAIFVPEAATGAVFGGGVALSLIVTLIVTLIFAIILTPAIINFARKESFGAAFKFGELFGMIGKLGWGKYILSWIVLIIFYLIFYLILSLILTIIFMVLGFTPVVGGLLITILCCLLMPFLMIFEYKYYANLFE